MPPPSNPRITVLMTLYNKGPYVVDALRSVLASTFTDMEVLVVDDASTDGGFEQVLSVKDERIRVLRAERNQGRAASANKGLENARGEMIAILDADDLMHKDRLRMQVEFMDAHPAVVACGSWIRGFGQVQNLHRTPVDDTAARAIQLFGVPVSYGTAMFRRSVIERHQVRCRSDWRTPGMDYLFVLEIGKYGEYANLQTVLTEYRLGEQNMRHGRDVLADDRILFRAVMQLFDVGCSDEELDAHLALNKVLPGRIDPRSVHAVHRWRSRLPELITAKGWACAEQLKVQVDRRWAELFPILLLRSPRAAMVHFQLDPTLGKARQLLGHALRSMIPR